MTFFFFFNIIGISYQYVKLFAGFLCLSFKPNYWKLKNACLVFALTSFSDTFVARRMYFQSYVLVLELEVQIYDASSIIREREDSY